MDLDRCLAVGGGAEHLGFGGRDGGIALDQRGHNTAQRLDTHRERRHVQEQDVLYLPLENAGLDGGADRDHLVRVDPLVRVLAKELLHLRHHCRHPGRAADQDNLVDVGRRHPGVLQGVLRGSHRALDQVYDKLLQFGACQGHRQVLRAGCVGRDERQIQLSLRDRRQLDLGPLTLNTKTLKRGRVASQIDSVISLKLVRRPVDDRHVKVVAAEMGVSVGRLDLENAVADLKDRDVESPAAEVVHGDRLVNLALHAVRKRGRGRLVDDAQHL